MRYNLLFKILFVLHNSNGNQVPRVDFMAEREPLNKLIMLTGKKILVTGFVKKTVSMKNKRIWIIGKWGDPIRSIKHDETLEVVLGESVLSKFKEIKDENVLNSFAFISGKIIRTKGHLELILTDRKSLVFQPYIKPPPLK